MKSPSLFKTIAMIWGILSRSERRQWFSIVGMAVVTSVLEVITAIVIVAVVQSLNDPRQAASVFDRLGMFSGMTMQGYMVLLLLGFGAIFLFKNMFAAFEIFCQSLTIQAINRDLKNRMLSSYGNASYSFYQTRTSSHLLNVVNGDVDMVCINGLLAFATLISESCVMLFLLVTVTVINPQITLTIMMICLVVGFIMFRLLLPRYYRWGAIGQQATMECYHSLIEFFQGFKEILLYGQVENFRKRFDVAAKRRSMVTARYQAVSSIPRIGIEVVFVSLFVVAVLLLLAKDTPMHEIAGLMGAYLYAGFRMMPGMNRIIVQAGNLKLVTPNIERVSHELSILPKSSTIIDCPAFGFTQDISFDRVSFFYEGHNNPALADVSLTIKRGEIIGIIGETGSGKSTLMDMILGLHLPTQGRITVDGQYPVHCQQWHRMIGYVPQSVYLFDGTLRENILLGMKEESATDDFLMQIIRDAQMEGMIARLPQGLDTQVGERGMRLSGGERQRIAIARALSRKPEVLIFDEATSALDNLTEAKLIETIHSVSQNKTVIMIAHRLTTLRDCERIYVLQAGKIDRELTYQELISIP